MVDGVNKDPAHFYEPSWWPRRHSQKAALMTEVDEDPPFMTHDINRVVRDPFGEEVTDGVSRKEIWRNSKQWKNLNWSGEGTG